MKIHQKVVTGVTSIVFLIFCYSILCYVVFSGCAKNQMTEPTPCYRTHTYQLIDSTGVISSGEWEEPCED